MKTRKIITILLTAVMALSFTSAFALSASADDGGTGISQASDQIKPAIIGGARPSVKLGAKTYQIKLDTKGTDLSATYVASSPGVASVNKTTGEVTLLRTGSTMIMVTVKLPDDSTWIGTINLVIEK